MVEGTVENSILFRGVRIAPDAHVKNCIIMHDGVSGRADEPGVALDHCLLVQNAVFNVGSGMHLTILHDDAVFHMRVRRNAHEMCLRDSPWPA